MSWDDKEVGTASELQYLANIGLYKQSYPGKHNKKTKVKDLESEAITFTKYKMKCLANYIQAAQLRHNWDRMDRDKILTTATLLHAKFEKLVADAHG